MTKIPTAPSKINRKGEPPQKSETRSNLSKPSPNKITVLNFRVSEEFKRDLKVAAASNGITQTKLLQEAFEMWKQRYG